jgi:hypothetical protein
MTSSTIQDTIGWKTIETHRKLPEQQYSWRELCHWLEDNGMPQNTAEMHGPCLQINAIGWLLISPLEDSVHRPYCTIHNTMSVYG